MWTTGNVTSNGDRVMAKTEKHIAVYVRVSSKQQDTKSQEPDLKAWAAAYAGDTPVKFYRDKFTGKTMDRPGWKRLEQAYQSGKISKVVCWRLDRLGRTAPGLTALFKDLQDRKVTLVSIKDGLDLSTAAGRLMANVLASVAAYETEIRAERVLAGQAKARAEGRTWGGSEAGRLLKVTKEQLKTVKRMSKDGESKTAMARATGLSRPTIYRLLEQHVG